MRRRRGRHTAQNRSQQRTRHEQIRRLIVGVGRFVKKKNTLHAAILLKYRTNKPREFALRARSTLKSNTPNAKRTCVPPRVMFGKRERAWKVFFRPRAE